MSLPAAKTWVGGAVLVVLAATVGFLAGDASNRPEWRDATVHVVGEQAHPLVSFDADGWTYAIEDSVTHWVDAEGTTHAGGWPDCLVPNETGEGTQVPRTVRIRFAWIDLELDGTRWREVVAVDCRPAAGETDD